MASEVFLICLENIAGNMMWCGAVLYGGIIKRKKLLMKNLNVSGNVLN